VESSRLDEFGGSECGALNSGQEVDSIFTYLWRGDAGGVDGDDGADEDPELGEEGGKGEELGEELGECMKCRE